MLKKILLIVMAIVVWAFFYFFLHWFPNQIPLSIVIAISGALLGGVAYWAISQHANEFNVLSYVFGLVGAITFSYFFSAAITLPTPKGSPAPALVTRTVSMWIDCDGAGGAGDFGGPDVYSNYIAVSPGDSIKFASDRAREYKIEFNALSPFGPRINPLMIVTVPAGQDRTVTVDSSAQSTYYSFNVRCPSASTSVITFTHSPMIQIPRQY
jgi:hypothetical protein